jgi:hypothetical protein
MFERELETDKNFFSQVATLMGLYRTIHSHLQTKLDNFEQKTV